MRIFARNEKKNFLLIFLPQEIFNDYKFPLKIYQFELEVFVCISKVVVTYIILVFVIRIK